MASKELHWISLVLRCGFIAHRPKTFKIHLPTLGLDILYNRGFSMLYIRYHMLLQKHIVLQEDFVAVRWLPSSKIQTFSCRVPRKAPLEHCINIIHTVEIYMHRVILHSMWKCCKATSVKNSVIIVPTISLCPWTVLKWMFTYSSCLVGATQFLFNNLSFHL